MKARRDGESVVVLHMSQAEAVVLHEVIAWSQWSNDLTAIELREPVERKVISSIQQILGPLIPGLGTDGYGHTVRAAFTVIENGESDAG